jgi:hypothetical protein
VTEKSITPKSNLRGVISVAKSETFASISVAVFDGKGKISEMDSILPIELVRMGKTVKTYLVHSFLDHTKSIQMEGELSISSLM